MSVSLRDQRWDLLPVTNTGANGYASPTYGTATTWWARGEPPRGGMRYPGLAEEQVVAMVVALPDECPVTPHALVRDPNGVVYKVLTLLPRRRQREVQAVCETADAASWVTV